MALKIGIALLFCCYCLPFNGNAQTDTVQAGLPQTWTLQQCIDYAKQHNMPVMVYCPFVAAYLKRHPEYNEMVDKNYTH